VSAPARRIQSRPAHDRRRREAADFRACARHRDGRARERLIEAYLPLAASVARRFVHGNPDLLDDVKQVAAMALVKAVDRYDPDNGNAFSSFAVPTIEGEIRRYFRDYTWAVRVPRDLQERAVRLERDRDALSEDLGRAPTAQELADWSHCTVEEIVDALEASDARVGDSFDRPVAADDDGGRTLAERLGAPDDGYEGAEARALLDPLLATLDERERDVIRMYLHEDMTQAEIGREIGCSQMHVSRIYRGAVTKLVAAAT
jgi:RNA polymerase sigma-B factor